MKELLKIWLILFLAHLFSRTSISILAFRSLDLRFEVFVQIVIIPICQATAIWSFRQGIRPSAATATLKQMIRAQPVLGILLLIDLALLALGWLPSSVKVVDLTSPSSIIAYYSALKGLFGGLLILVLVITGTWSAADRFYLLIFGGGLMAYGVDYFVHWLQGLPELLFLQWPLLFRWLFTFGPLFIMSLLLLLRVVTIWKRQSLESARLLDWASAFYAVAATVVVLSFFNRPLITGLWLQVVKTCSFLAISLIWISLLHFRRSIHAAPLQSNEVHPSK